MVLVQQIISVELKPRDTIYYITCHLVLIQQVHYVLRVFALADALHVTWVCFKIMQ